MSNLRIPSVTPADLRDFHLRHFSAHTGSNEDGPAGQQAYVPGTRTEERTEHVSDELEADDLGSYPDGVKRTLTDEQVSMFRHSEIYSLIRKRQLQKENGEADGTLSADPMDDESPIADSGQSIENAGNAPREIDPKGKTIATDGTAPTKNQKNDLDGDRTWYSATSRRQIRELDDAVPDAEFLDYGDGTNTGQSEKHTLISDTSSRGHVDYTDDMNQENGPEKDRLHSPKQGRKIWWPSIGSHTAD